MRSALACLLLWLIAAPGLASADWTAPQVAVEDGRDDQRPVAVVDDGGRTLRLAVADYGTNQLLLREAPFGGRLGPARRTAPTPDLTTAGLTVTGDGVALGARRDGPLRATAFQAAGATDAPEVLAAKHSGYDLAVAGSGAAVAAWADGNRVLAAIREPGARRFGTPVPVGPARGADVSVDLGITDAGEVVLLWQVNEYPSDTFVTIRPAGGTFGAPQALGETSGAAFAVGPDGTAIVADTTDTELRVATRAPGAPAFGPLTTVDTAAGSYNMAAAAAGGGGRVGAIWTVAASERAKTRLRVMLGTAGGAVKRVGTLGRGVGLETALAVDDRGRAVVAWAQQQPAVDGSPVHRERLALAYKGIDRGFGATRLVSPTVLSAMPLAINLSGPSGRASVVYELFEDFRDQAYRRFDLTFSRP
jgi:hypothetical protein